MFLIRKKYLYFESHNIKFQNIEIGKNPLHWKYLFIQNTKATS